MDLFRSVAIDAQQTRVLGTGNATQKSADASCREFRVKADGSFYRVVHFT